MKEKEVRRDSRYHRLFGLKAAKEAAKILKIFEKECPNDHAPRLAIQAIQSRAEGKRKLNLKEVRKLSLDAHASARKAKSDIAKYAAHAAGQAVATWHVPTHALSAFRYIGKAMENKKSK